MSVISFRQKFLLIIGAVLFTATALEVSLHLGKTVFLSVQTYQNLRGLKSKDSYRVMCVGESTTALGGRDSYPAQLEEILNTGQSLKSFNVINKGVPGIGSDFIRANFEEWLEEFRPDLVIIMRGINDPHQQVIIQPKDLPSRILHVLQNTQIAKLIRWISTHLKKRTGKEGNAGPRTESTANDVSPSAYEESILKELRQLPASYKQLYSLAVMLETKKNYTQAQGLFAKLLDANLSQELNRWFAKRQGDCLLLQNNYNDLTELVIKKFDQNPQDVDALNWFAEILENDPSSTRTLVDFLQKKVRAHPQEVHYLDLLAACHNALGDSVLYQRYRLSATRLRRGEYNPVTQRNFQSMLESLRQRDIIALVVQYPLRELSPLKKIIEASGKSDRVFYVDNYTSFHKVISVKGYQYYFKDRFAGDFGHCTPEGNRLLARNIARMIIRILGGRDK